MSARRFFAIQHVDLNVKTNFGSTFTQEEIFWFASKFTPRITFKKMASIARRTLMNLFDCIRCFLRSFEATAWLPIGFHTEQRYGVFPHKSIIEQQILDWNDVKVQTNTAKMLLNITQTVQEMQQTATVALITASLTAPVGSILLKAPTHPKLRMDNKAIDLAIKRHSLSDITCSFIDSTPSYCYFIINSSNTGRNKSVSRAFVEKLRNTKANTDCDADNDANNNSFNSDDVAAPRLNSSSVLLPRQRTFSESSDDNFICFLDEDDDDDDIDCKASSGSSKNYGYYSNQYDTETDCSSDDSCDEEDEEDEDEDCDCVMLTDKKVRFDPNPKVHVMRTWSYAYRSARKGEWESIARDRVRFQNRIQRAAACLDPVLDPHHRQQIYANRFDPLNQHRNEQEPNHFDKPF